MFKTDRKDRIGQLSEYISIYKMTEPKDSVGALTKTKQILKENLSANITYNNAEEGIEGQKVLLTQSLNVIIRTIEIDETYSITYQGKDYDIVSITPIERNNYLSIKMLEKTHV